MKKFLSLVLAFSMLLSAVYTVNAEDAGLLDSEAVETELVDEFADDYIDLDPVEDEQKEDIVIKKQPYITEEEYEASYIEVLYGLGILNYEEDATRIIKRGEFAHYLCFLAGLHEDGIYGVDMNFVDTENSAFINEINCVASSGYMNGYGDGIFAPDNEISTIEAATAILRMAGYKKLAENNGGYPQGYIKFASATELFEDVTVENSLTYENLVKLVYNALFVPLVKVEGGSYTADEDENVLTRRIDAECLKGRITATAFTSLDDKDTASENHVTVTVDGEDYTLDASDLATDDLLGLSAYFYIKDESELVAVEPLKNKYSSVKIERAGIVSVDEGLTVIEAIKDAESSAKKYTIDTKAEFIYNGKNCFEVTKDEIENINGNIRLVDCDRDGKYDIVYIWNYETYFVSSTNAAETIINDKKTGKFLKLDEQKTAVKYYKYGKIAEFTNIAENDVLSVATSKPVSGETLITINISPTSVEGILKQIGEVEITIDDNTYIMSKDFNLDGISVGTKALFGINFMGEVCCYSKVYTTNKEYGYLVDAFEGEDDDGECYILKFLAESGNVERAVLAEKFNLNNERSTFDGVLSALTVDGAIKKQLIAFNRNSDGEIIKLYTSGAETAVSEETSYEKLTFNKKYTNLRFRRQTIQGEYITGTNTKIFLVALDRNSELMEDSSGVYTPSTNPVADGYRPTTYIYDAGADLIAGAIVFEIPESSYSSMLGNVSTYSILVNRISKVIDENNDEVTKVFGYLQGAEVSYIIDDSLDVSDWNRGDIRMLSASKKTGKIVKSRQFFGISNNTGAAPASVLYRDTDYSVYPSKYNITEGTDNTSQESPVYGTIESVSYNPGYVIVNLADGSGYRIGRIVSYSNFHTYGEKGGFGTVTSADIVPGKEVYMMTRFGNIMEFVMFED